MLIYNGEWRGTFRWYKCDKCGVKVDIHTIHEIRLGLDEWSLCDTCLKKVQDYVKEM